MTLQLLNPGGPVCLLPQKLSFVFCLKDECVFLSYLVAFQRWDSVSMTQLITVRQRQLGRCMVWALPALCHRTDTGGQMCAG